MSGNDIFIHPTALVETEAIGTGTRIWANVHIMRGVTIGPQCNICDGTFIEAGTVIGRGVTIKPLTALGEGVTIEDGVFIGPGVMFTNDLRPRSPRLALAAPRYAHKESWLLPTRICTGATLGAGVTVSCGITIGAWSFSAAGAALLQSVPDHALMVGNPARQIGFVCACSENLTVQDGQATCASCRRSYALADGRLQPLQPINLWENT